MASEPTAAAPPADSSNLGVRVVVVWLILSAIATPLVAIYVGPLIPPGNGSVQAQGQTFSNQVMVSFVTPILCLMAVFFAYGLVKFHANRNEAVLDGPPLRNDSRIQLLWLVITTTMVLFLAGFGTYELLKDGAGGGQGPNPIALPANHRTAFPVQVIGQQWEFTYRYPTFGGMESNQLVLPENTLIVFHVTSLDVIHSFWAYQLGVKADAVPGADNIAFTVPKHTGLFEVRCAELCGLYHGYMAAHGRVLSKSGFAAWIAKAQKFNAPIMRYLPKYAKVYYPLPLQRGG
jgi:cytochrome c oxidase subunit II